MLTIYSPVTSAKIVLFVQQFVGNFLAMKVGNL